MGEVRCALGIGHEADQGVLTWRQLDDRFRLRLLARVDESRAAGERPDFHRGRRISGGQRLGEVVDRRAVVEPEELGVVRFIALVLQRDARGAGGHLVGKIEAIRRRPVVGVLNGGAQLQVLRKLLESLLDPNAL